MKNIRSIVSMSDIDIVTSINIMNSKLDFAITNASTISSYGAYNVSDLSRRDALTAVCDAIGIPLAVVLDACGIIMDTYDTYEYGRRHYGNTIKWYARQIRDHKDIKENARMISAAVARVNRTYNNSYVIRLQQAAERINNINVGPQHNARYIEVIRNAIIGIAKYVHELRDAVILVTSVLEKCVSVQGYPEHVQVIMDMLMDMGHIDIVNHILGLPGGSNDLRPLGNLYSRSSNDMKIAIEKFIDYIPMHNVILAGCNLRGISIESVNMTGSIFSGTDFTGANITKCNMAGCNIDNASFDNAVLSRTIITSQMKNVTFNNADISDATFANCGIRNTSFDGAKAPNTKFISCDIRDSIFGSIRDGHVTVVDTVMDSVDFTSANLYGASFRNSVLDRCSFSGANLRGMLLRNTDVMSCTVDQHTENSGVITGA